LFVKAQLRYDLMAQCSQGSCLLRTQLARFVVEDA
jgi:hypothetical protein